MLRQAPRALVAWLTAGVVALVTAQTVASDLAALHRRARDAGREVSVFVAARDLPLGHTVARGDLRAVTRFEAHVPPEAAPAGHSLDGRVVVTPVLAGSFVTERHLAPAERTGLDGVVPPGMRAMRVVIDDGLQPAPGAAVDVLVSFDPAIVGADAEPTLAVVRGALVIAVDDAGAPEGNARVGVTLLVDDDGARRLAFAAANGIVTLTLAPPEEACCRPSSSDSSRD